MNKFFAGILLALGMTTASLAGPVAIDKLATTYSLPSTPTFDVCTAGGVDLNIQTLYEMEAKGVEVLGYREDEGALSVLIFSSDGRYFALTFVQEKDLWCFGAGMELDEAQARELFDIVVIKE